MNSPTPQATWCTFTLDGELFGVDVTCVQEVLRQVEMTPVPLAPADDSWTAQTSFTDPSPPDGRMIAPLPDPRLRGSAVRGSSGMAAAREWD